MKRYVLIFVLFFLGCTPKKSRIDTYFYNLDKTLSNEEKDEIRKCKDAGCLSLFLVSKASKRFLDSLKSVPSELNILLSDSIKIHSLNDRYRVLVLAYQRRLNNQVIDFFKIKNEIIQFDSLQTRRYLEDYAKEIKTQIELARNNYEKFKIGDTLNLLYPVEKRGNHKGVYFNNFYYKTDYYDTLFLKCILVKKEIKSDKNIDLYDGYYFLLKILEAKNKELNMIDKEYHKGNIISLPVYDYGRSIESYQ